MRTDVTLKHDTEESARKEAERPTRTYGGKFHVLELVAAVERMEVIWQTATNPPQRLNNSPELSDLVNDDYDDRDPFAE